MWILDKLDKILPGSAFQTTASLTKGIRQQYVDEYVKAASKFAGATDPHMDWATRSEHQWKERAKSMRGKCLWCTTPYEDESGSCTKCGAPKEVVDVQPRFSNVTWRI